MYIVLCTLALLASAQAYTTILQKGFETTPLRSSLQGTYFIPAGSSSGVLSSAQIGCYSSYNGQYQTADTLQVAVNDDGGNADVTIRNDLLLAEIRRSGSLNSNAMVTVSFSCPSYNVAYGADSSGRSPSSHNLLSEIKN